MPSTASPISPDVLKGLYSLATPGTLASSIAQHRAKPRGSLGRRSDLEWVPAPHLELIDRRIRSTVLQDATSSRVLLIDAPPRHGKSELISKWTPSWVHFRWPWKHVVVTGYADSVARRWGRRCRAILKEFGGPLGVEISRDSAAANDWEVAHHGGTMRTAGAGGQILGFGADVLVIDDYLKNPEEALSEGIRQKLWEWWQGSVWNRLEPGGCVIVTAQRWHQDDLAGRMLKHAEQNADFTVEHISLPALARAGDVLGREEGEALWPWRYDRKALLAIEAGLEAYWWQAQYQQHPGTHGASEWEPSYFDDIWADEIAWPDAFESSVIWVDPSKGGTKGDYIAVVFLGLSGGRYWIDSLMLKTAISETCEAICTFDELHGFVERIGVEGNAMQDLAFAPPINAAYVARQLPPPPLATMTNSKSKVKLRIPRLGPMLRNGLFRFRKQSQGNAILVQQLRDFPFTLYDDGPDGLESAVRLHRAHLRKAGLADPTEVITT